MSLIPASPTSSTGTTLAPTADPATQRYIDASVPPNTRRAYTSAWASFARWCKERGCSALPATAETLADYLAACADSGLRVSTIEQRRAAVLKAHELAGHDQPTGPVVHQTLRGIRRARGSAPQRHAAATRPLVIQMLATITGSGPKAVRDRALMLLAFAGAFRRSELVALQRDDLVLSPGQGYEVRLKRSKTNQDGNEEIVAVPYGSEGSLCPVQALERWLALHPDAPTTGPVFVSVNRHGQLGTTPLTAQAFADVVKRAARGAGLDASRFSPHSLRAGLITSAIEAGVSEGDTMAHSRHRSIRVFRGYVRRQSRWQVNAARSVL